MADTKQLPALRERQGRRRGFFVAAALLLCCGQAFAQYIKIPDFRNSSPPSAAAPRAGEVCDNCGVIRSIREIEGRRAGALPNSLQPDPADRGAGGSTVRVGAVIALPMSESGGGSYVGGVGTPEMRARFADSSYDVTIRLDSGATTVVSRRDGGRFQVGDRVRVRGIDLELVAP